MGIFRGSSMAKHLRILYIQIVIFLADPLLLHLIDDHGVGYSLIFFLNFIVGLTSLWVYGRKTINLLILVYLTSALFIGGRFFSSILGNDLSIWETTFFYSYQVDEERQTDIMKFVLLYFNGLTFGYILFKLFPVSVKREVIKIQTIRYLNLYLAILFIPVALYILVTKIKQFVLASQMGYVAIYLAVNQNGGGSDFLYTIFLFLFGLAMAYGTKIIRTSYVSLFVVASLIMIVIGARGMFGSVLLVLFWIYSQYHRIDLRKIITFICIGGLALIAFSSISIRNADIEESLSVLKAAQLFLYDQGVSLMVFDTSRLLDNYPWQPFFQNFIPGFVRITEFFTAQPVGTDATFAAYMCSTINPQLYASGNGLGWTLMSDLFLYSFGNKLLFLLFVILFSYGCSIIVENINRNGLVKTIAYTIATSLVILPRSGLNSTIPLIYYAIFGWVALMGSSQLLKHVNE